MLSLAAFQQLRDSHRRQRVNPSLLLRCKFYAWICLSNGTFSFRLLEDKLEVNEVDVVVVAGFSMTMVLDRCDCCQFPSTLETFLLHSYHHL